MNKPLPTQAQVVIIGGGALGTSIGYHLARAGVKDVVLLEKTLLTEGATWHAAGLVGQARSQENLTRLMQNSVTVFSELEAETGQDPSWRQTGSLRLAVTKDRWQELLKGTTSAKATGFDIRLLSPTEAKELYPIMEVDDLIGAAFIPEDGYIDPNGLTQAFAKGMRAAGGKIYEGVMVTGLSKQGDRITHVETDQGTIAVETVVNAAGLWARQVGWMAGVEIPAGIVEHQYLVTEKTEAIPDGLPSLRDPDGNYYAKPEPGALAIGGWEKGTPSVDPVEGFPWDASRHLFDGNYDRLEEFFAPALARIPLLGDLGVRTLINGPIPISPDGEPVMGPMPGLDNMFVACAFTSGIAASGGAGMALANWIAEGDPGLDLWSFDIRRFGPLQAGADFLHERAVESYSKYYAVHYPGEELESARPLRRSSLYEILKDQGAVFGSKFGWERANWFAHGDIAQVDVPSFNRDAFETTVGREHRAAREGVVLFDQSSFTKFEISGPNAHTFLQYLAVASIGAEAGNAAYSQLCNDRGGIEADVTIICRGENLFWLITGSGLSIRDGQWIKTSLDKFQNRLGGGSGVEIRDITSAYGVLNIAGPLARQVMEKVSYNNFAHQAFPFMSAEDVRIGQAPALAYRVTYIGELGWELYIPSEYVSYVYETLMAAGEEFQILNAGYRAIDSLRMEKRYLAWGADITPDHNPFEAGLQFLIDFAKADFQGAEALAKIKSEGVTRKLVCLAVNDLLPVFGGEAIYANGQIVGQATSGNFGYSVGKSLILGYVPIASLGADTFEVEAFGERKGASIIKGAAYDTGRKKILC